jgi:hypothetical protein
MQIHEITALREGILDTLKDLKASYKTPGAFDSNKFNQSKNQAKSEQQTAEYVKKLAAEWAQVAKTLPTPEPEGSVPTPADSTTATKPPVQQKEAGESITVTMGNQTFVWKNDGQGWKDQKTKKPVDPALAKRLDATLPVKQKPMKYTKVNEAFNDLPGGVAPAGNPVDPSVTAMPKQFQQNTAMRKGNRARKFLSWSDGKLAATIPGTRQTLNMDMVRKDPTTGQQLNSALTKVVKTENDPTANAAAVEEYLTIAVQGIQKLSAQLKQQDPALAQASKKYQLGAGSRKNNMVKSTKNPEADEVLRQQGFQVQ